MIRPTELAPDFEAEAYHLGNKVIIRLDDFQNQWVLLFFYAGDFTFV